MGEGEEAVRERIAKEFRWAESKEEAEEEGGGEEADPLDAFMAGIEVSVCVPLLLILWVGSVVMVYLSLGAV